MYVDSINNGHLRLQLPPRVAHASCQDQNSYLLFECLIILNFVTKVGFYNEVEQLSSIVE